MIVTYWWFLAVVDGGNDGVKTVEKWILDSVTYGLLRGRVDLNHYIKHALSFCLFDGVIYEVQRSLFIFYFFLRYREVSVNGPVLYLYILQVGFVYLSWAPLGVVGELQRIPRSSNHSSQVKPSFIIYFYIRDNIEFRL